MGTGFTPNAQVQVRLGTDGVRPGMPPSPQYGLFPRMTNSMGHLQAEISVPELSRYCLPGERLGISAQDSRRDGGHWSGHVWSNTRPTTCQ